MFHKSRQWLNRFWYLKCYFIVSYNRLGSRCGKKKQRFFPLWSNIIHGTIRISTRRHLETYSMLLSYSLKHVFLCLPHSPENDSIERSGINAAWQSIQYILKKGQYYTLIVFLQSFLGVFHGIVEGSCMPFNGFNCLNYFKARWGEEFVLWPPSHHRVFTLTLVRS